MKTHRKVKGRAARIVKRRVGPPKFKRVVLSPLQVAQIEAPPEHVPVLIPGPDPQHVRVASVPKDKTQTWMEYFFGPERKQ